ncbi:MAG: PD-(D/E)XK nuclease family protein [Solirubrobacteraceae bacterium]
MPLTLITGPANAAKAGEVLGRFRAVLDRAPLLVVPTAADVDHFQRELAAGGPLVGGSVVPFGSLVRSIAEAAGVEGRPLGPVARERVVVAAVRDAGLRELRASAECRGFAAAAGALIAELGRAGVSPEAFRAALPGRARELGALVAAYHARLDRLGRDDAERLAARAVAGLEAAPDRWPGRPVLLYGFDDLTPLQVRAIRALAARCEVTVALTWETGRAAFAARDRAAHALLPDADEHVALPALADHYAAPAREALHHLERHLFEDGAAPVGDPEGIVLLEAGGERAEAELVAAEVLDALRAGVPAEQVAVVVRAPDRSGPLLERVLHAYGVPFVLRRTVPFGHTVLGRALCGMLRCALGGGEVADLLAWLRAPGVLDRPELADGLEARLRREGARDGATARKRFEERHFPLDELDRTADAAAAGPRALAERLDRAIGRLLAAPRKRGAAVLDGPERVDARAAAAARGALAELVDPSLPPASPSETLDLLAALPVRIGEGPRPGAVEVSDPLSVRARRYRVVIVAGLQEGELPRVPPPDPFLDDALRARLADAGLPLASRDALADERHLFYACASRPTERLVLSHRTADEEGGLATPSFFLDDVRALFDTPLAVRCRPLAEVAWPLESAPTPAERDRALAAAGPPQAPPVLGSLITEAARAALVEQPAMSASGLESYAGCPVRWLVDHHLRPRALEPDSPALLRGSLAHRTLATAFQRLRERRGSARVDKASLPDALEALDEALAQHAPDIALHPDPAVRAALLRGVEADLRRTLEHETSCPTALEPEHFEVGFGREEHDLPVVELAAGRVTLRGQIDRVDVDHERGEAVVRDYKARDRHPVDAWERDTRLQVALYMLAVQRLLGLRPVAGLYQPLSGSDLRARGLVREDAAERVGGCVGNDVKDAEAFEATLEAAEARASALADQLAAGELRPCPATCSPRGCAYPGVCRGGQP